VTKGSGIAESVPKRTLYSFLNSRGRQRGKSFQKYIIGVIWSFDERGNDKRDPDTTKIRATWRTTLWPGPDCAHFHSSLVVCQPLASDRHYTQTSTKIASDTSTARTHQWRSAVPTGVSRTTSSRIRSAPRVLTVGSFVRTGWFINFREDAHGFFDHLVATREAALVVAG
jgi:hypothetical protein